MKYSDTTNLNGIIQEEERLTGLGYAGISGSTNNLKEFTSLNNIESHKIWHTIFMSNGNWQYDDSLQVSNPTTPGTVVFTTTIAAPGVFSLTGHGFVVGDIITLSTTGALPTGLAIATKYYVITAGLTTDAFQVSATSGGTAVTTSGSQSGVQTLTVATSFPAATISLVDGTTDYTLPSGALTVKRIEVMDSSDNWSKLNPITLEEMGTKGEFLTDDGTPRFYTLTGNKISVFPASTYDSSNGMKVFFDRDCVEYATTDTTRVPSFASPYHSIISIAGALAWLKTKAPTSPKIPILINDYKLLEIQIKQFYSARFKDKKPRVGRAYSNYK